MNRRAGSFIIFEWLSKTIAATDSKKQPHGKCDDAKSFFDYLKSSKARPAFEKQGFTVLVKSASST